MSKSREEKAARDKAYYIANREKILARFKAYRSTHRKENASYCRAYYIAHREEFKARNRTYHITRREGIKDQRMLRVYGLSQTAFNSLFNKQGGICAICGNADWNGQRPCIDHDHVTGKVRGLLCSKCNTAQGLIKEDPDIARAMVDYLEGHLQENPPEAERDGAIVFEAGGIPGRRFA